MVELKKKLGNLNLRLGLTKQGPKPSDESAESLVNEPIVLKFKEDARVLPFNNPHYVAEVLDSIIEIYYSDESSFDASDYELKKLPQFLDINELNISRKKMKEQLSVVSKKVSDLILENHPSYSTELQRVTDLQQSLTAAHSVCVNSRSKIQKSQLELSVTGVKILANFRKKQLLRSIHRALQTIKTLQDTDARLRELLEEENFCGAIQVCMECQNAALTLRHYRCISELNAKLQDTQIMMEEQLDRALGSQCLTFDGNTYSRLFSAYQLLGKSHTALDQLLMHYSSTIHNSAATVISDYMTQSRSPVSGTKQAFPDLCKSLPPEQFTACLLELCQMLWRILYSYHSLYQWHCDHSALVNAAAADSTKSGNVGQLIMQKLEGNLDRIWQDALQKIVVLFQTADLTGFKFDNFMTIIDIVNRVVRIGRSNFACESDSLLDVLRQQSVTYFKAYHRARLDELRLYLEAEAWELCPVKSGFTLLHLHEFRFMKRKVEQVSSSLVSNGVVPTALNLESHGVVINGSNPSASAVGVEKEFLLLCGSDNPFIKLDESSQLDETFDANDVHNDEDNDSDSDVPDEVKGDFIDELTGKAMSKANTRPSFRRLQSFKPAEKLPPLLSNTALNVLRIFGRYLNMVDLLESIAFDVVVAIAQLFDYYFYVVYYFFGRDAADITLTMFSPNLKSCLHRIENTLVVVHDAGHLPSMGDSSKVLVAQMSAAVNFHFSDRLHALAERIVGVESLIYVAQQLQFLHAHMQHLVPENKKAFLVQFYAQTVYAATDLRRVIYGAVASKALNYSHLLQQLSTVNWDINELMSQHSGYVDFIVQDCEKFALRLSEVAIRVPVTRECYVILWEHAIRTVNRILVDGFANARRCSNEGRALMQLDFQQLLLKLEKLTDIRPIPDREYVEVYIKAFYLPENSIEQWIREHKEYSARQIIGLLNVAGHISRKTKQRLIGNLEDAALTRTVIVQ